MHAQGKDSAQCFINLNIGLWDRVYIQRVLSAHTRCVPKEHRRQGVAGFESLARDVVVRTEAGAGIVATSCNSRIAEMVSALEALDRLRAGNRRFVSDMQDRGALTSQARRMELTSGQAPFAVILGCSDSRVPVEIVFDQGLGDLFVIRVAGNIVAPSQIGSVEFAAEQYGTRLVVVLGHSRCGAILATLEQLKRPVESQSRNLHSIVNRVRPSVEGLLRAGLDCDHDALVHQAVRANIRASASHLRHGSELIEQMVDKDGLLVVGAEYSLETGEVDFFDGIAAGWQR